jgi:hypothetical protein
MMDSGGEDRPRISWREEFKRNCRERGVARTVVQTGLAAILILSMLVIEDVFGPKASQRIADSR